jgi:hypothetical protein
MVSSIVDPPAGIAAFRADADELRHAPGGFRFFVLRIAHCQTSTTPRTTTSQKITLTTISQASAFSVLTRRLPET